MMGNSQGVQRSESEEAGMRSHIAFDVHLKKQHLAKVGQTLETASCCY